MAKTGRKNAYETIIKPRFNEILEWLKNGATEKQIAENLGVAYSTYLKHKAENVEFSELIKKGRESLVLKLRGTLVKKAFGFQYTEIKKIKYTDENGDVKERIEETTKASLPDVAALNLCLKNYDSEEWANDPQMLRIKREELKIKQENADKNNW